MKKPGKANRLPAYFALWAWTTLFGIFIFFLFAGVREWLHSYPKYVQPDGELTETAKLILAVICLPVLYAFSQVVVAYIKRQKEARDILNK